MTVITSALHMPACPEPLEAPVLDAPVKLSFPEAVLVVTLRDRSIGKDFLWLHDWMTEPDDRPIYAPDHGVHFPLMLYLLEHYLAIAEIKYTPYGYHRWAAMSERIIRIPIASQIRVLLWFKQHPNYLMDWYQYRLDQDPWERKLW